jgi:hypothetical protein
MEEGARVRLEGERGSRFVERFRPRQRSGNDGLVAAVNAVEIADGNDRPA